MEQVTDKQFEELEDVNFKIEKRAFEPKELTCSKCKRKMKKADLVFSLSREVTITLHGFECSKCRNQYLGLKEATKLDRAMILNRVMKDGFKMERSISYDGDNWTMRIPKEFTHDVHKKKVDIIPLGARQFCGIIK